MTFKKFQPPTYNPPATDERSFTEWAKKTNRMARRAKKLAKRFGHVRPGRSVRYSEDHE